MTTMAFYSGVSASDIERHVYCPLSWELAKQGNTGQGEAVEFG